jgi:hypothetical protein
MEVYGCFIVNAGNHKEQMIIYNATDKCVGDRLYCLDCGDEIIVTNNAVRIPTNYNTINGLDYIVSEEKIEQPNLLAVGNISIRLGKDSNTLMLPT